MACVIINYDLNREGAGYAAKNKRVTDHIKQLFPTYWHHLDSMWIVETHLTPLEVANAVWSQMDGNDKLFVSPTNDNAAFGGVNDKGKAWLNSRL